MSEKNFKLIYTVYGIVTSLLLVISGILLMISCVQIYNIGPRPFTTENISNAFSKIAIPIYVTVGAIAVGFILYLIKPLAAPKTRALISPKVTLKRLSKRLDASKCNEETATSIANAKKLRKIARWITAGACVLAFIPSLVFVLNFNNFGSDYNAAVISAMCWIAPSCVISAGVCLTFSYVERASLNREIDSVKKAIASGARADDTEDSDCNCRCHCNKIVSAVRTLVAVIAIVFIIAGIFNGGMADVLSKAINICTECIGLG